MDKIEPEINPEKIFVDILQDAAQIAQRLGRPKYNTCHILLSILRKDSFLREWLAGKGVRFNDLIGREMPDSGFEPNVSEFLSRVRLIATTAQQPRKPIHALFGILGFGPNGSAFDAISVFTDPAALLREILEHHWLRNPPGESEKEKADEGEKKGIERYGIDFTQMAREGKLHGVIGRDEEIASIVRILAQKDMGAQHDEAINNPVLLGPPGTGKTALAKALAVLIAEKDPQVQILWDYRLVYIKLGTLLAGTAMRGSLESKIEEILSDCAKEKTIPFFDELHVIMGIGKSEGSPGMEEILKPILAEGLSCIGATTTEEWRREIEARNPPFAERWVPVFVTEPDEEKTSRIVHGAIHDLARRHVVHFPEEVMNAAVTLGRKYMTYEASPRRELDKILNGVGARVKIAGRTHATVEDVLAVIEQATGIPVSTQQVQQERLVNAFSILSEKIFGQDESNRAMASALQRFYSGMRDPNKPLVILMLGPTGVGKTLTAKTVSEMFLFGRIIRFDMSEYMEKHTVSRLLGSPPGYIGHEEPGQLTDKIRRMGEGIVLIDEVEKAHPNVLLALMTLFDEGLLTDGKGNTVNGKNCIFILTSNIGSECFATTSASSIGFTTSAQDDNSFESQRRRVIDQARSSFRPELWNRFDERLVFKPHDMETVRKIALALLGQEKEKSHELGFELSWSDAVVEYLAVRGYDQLYGARPMKRLIMKKIQTLLAIPVLDGQIARGDNVILEVIANEISWKKI